MKQTAVEWLIQHFTEYGIDLLHHELEIEQAKQMEKQSRAQHELAIDCLIDFVKAIDSDKVLIAEEYENAKVIIESYKS